LEITLGNENTKALQTIIKDLSAKPLLIIGGREAGKTIITKYLLDLAKQSYDNIKVRVYDNSVAWYHSAPLMYKQDVDPTFLQTRQTIYEDCLYEIGKLDKDQRRQFIASIIKNEYDQRYEVVKADPGNLSRLNWSLSVIEECQSLLDKYKTLGSSIHDWVSVGRNFKMTAMLCTQRAAEVDTTIVERCSILAGYCEGDNNLQKIRRATNKEFHEIVKATPFRSYYFSYWNGSIFTNIKVPLIVYPSPSIYPVTVTRPLTAWEAKMKL
jgi:hypothetical protein